MLSSVKIKVLDERIHHAFGLPKYSTSGSAGLDLVACIDQPLELQSQQVELLTTGIAIYLANTQFAAMILPRSGLGHKHGVVLGNQIGLIDADYQGPLKVSLYNRSQQSFVVHPGDRIAQLIFIPVSRPTWEIVDAFEESARGEGGFGSTGIKVPSS
jgi:dUTP pyrophosphatase